MRKSGKNHMKITAPTEAVSSPPEENEHWSQQWRRNTTCAGQKPRADWKNVLQIPGAGRKSRKPPTPFVGMKPYGKYQFHTGRNWICPGGGRSSADTPCPTSYWLPSGHIIAGQRRSCVTAARIWPEALLINTGHVRSREFWGEFKTLADHSLPLRRRSGRSS